MIFAENAIVEQTSDTDVKWYARCPYCGHINEYIKYRTVVNRNTRKSMGRHRCKRCNKDFEVYIINK